MAEKKSTRAKTSKTLTGKPAKSPTARPRNPAAARQRSPGTRAAKHSDSYTGLPGSQTPPTGIDESWRRIAAARGPAFDQSIPAYLLDEKYWFLDWNAAFDELIAKPLKLQRLRSHAEDFIRTLENVEDVYQRSKRVFGSREVPLVDTEPLQLRTEKYGLVEFEKVAVQIPNADAQLSAWAVYLNINQAEKAELLWKDLRMRWEAELNWSRYAISYDKLLLNFPDYDALLRCVVDRVADCTRCLDLGAGTGNATVKLLQSRQDRAVWAVESNHAMIQQLLCKVEHLEGTMGEDFFGRLCIWKEDLMRLDDCAEFLAPGTYDAAILTNVVYAVEDPAKLLREVAALLKKGGRVVLSTPHVGTDVDHLFARMRQTLESQGKFSALRANDEDARLRHLSLEPLIHRDTKSDIRRYVEEAGFAIKDWLDSEYTGAVVVVDAVKK